jgi:hypothetical protein
VEPNIKAFISKTLPNSGKSKAQRIKDLEEE